MGIKDLNIEQFKKIINSEKVILIDVRTEEEYNKGHINGAILIENYEIEYKIRKLEISKQDKIIVYCGSGMKSKNAQQILINMGYENVYNVKNGIQNI